MSKVKDHFKKYKVAYIVGGVGAVGIISAIVITRASCETTVGAKVIQGGLTFNGDVHNTNKTIINLVERSTPSKPVHLKGTNLYFSSINEAARETGHTLSQISKNVNGLIPDVKGDIFEALDLVA